MLLRVEGIGRAFAGIQALNGVTFEVAAGRIYGVIGPNGAGKTTLFNLISGVIPASAGTITFEGQDITRLKPHAIARRGISRTYQLVRPFYELTALENVKVGILFGRAAADRPAAAALDAEAEALLLRAGLAGKAGEPVSELNLGERKRLEIAKALAAKPRLVLFDEVLAGLNPTETAEAVRLFQDICAGGTTILMIEHNMQAIMSACHYLFVLHHGELIGQGEPQQVARDPAVIEAYLGKGNIKLERRRRVVADA